jgi:DNA (cytosine-5)-methyltransferase 1
MELIEKISIEDFNNKTFKVRVVEPINEYKASFTHYLHNHKNGVSQFYKYDAIKYVKSLLQYKNPLQNISDIIAEDALQLFLFDYQNEIPFPHLKYPEFTFIDLFAGIGGFRIALQNSGGKCVFSSEWDESAKQTYFENFGEIPFGDITKDITKKYIPNTFDILCAGFPCQAFSIAGRRSGFNDARGTLFFDIEQIIKKFNPMVVFLENVKNLISHDKGETFKIIIDILENKLGYKVYYKVLNSLTHANLPQNRERIFIVAFDPNQVNNFDKFKFPDKIKLTKTIHDILEKDKQNEKYYYQPNHKYYPELKKNNDF